MRTGLTPVFFFLIAFIRMTLIPQTIQVSGVQLNKTYAHGTACPFPQVKARILRSVAPTNE